MTSQRRRLAPAAIGVAALVTAALVVGVGHGDARKSSQPATTTTAPVLAPVAPAGPGPSTERAGIPVGFAHSEAGARAAAITYATASQRWMYFDDDGVERAVRGIASSAASARLVDEVGDEVRAAREGLTASAGRVWWIVRTLATRVESHRPDAARVSVWVVSVLSAADVAMPQSDWRTVTFELVWEDGDWRVDGIRDAPGPTPMLGPRDRPWPPELLDEHLDGFARLEVGAP